MKALCFALFACAFNLLHRLRRPALVRPRGVPRHRRPTSPAYAVEGLGPAADLGILAGTAARRRRWAWSSAGSRSAARASTSRWSRWRWRRWSTSSACRRRSPAARTASRRCRAASSSALIDLDDPLAMYYFVLAVFLAGFLLIVPHRPFAVRPGAEGDPRERAARRSRSATHRALQARWPSCCRRRCRAWPGRSRRSSSSSPRSPTCTGRCRATCVLMTLLGGIGTVFGPVVGAFVIVSMENYLAASARG